MLIYTMFSLLFFHRLQGKGLPLYRLQKGEREEWEKGSCVC